MTGRLGQSADLITMCQAFHASGAVEGGAGGLDVSGFNWKASCTVWMQRLDATVAAGSRAGREEGLPGARMPRERRGGR